MKDPSRVHVTGPLERYASSFLVELGGQGYAPDSAAHRMQLVACLSGWMAAEGVAVSQLSPERVERFVEWRRAAGYRHFRSPHGLTPLLVYLRALGAAPEPAAPRADGPIDALIGRYRAYVLGERGLAAGTVRYYERVARLFLVDFLAPDGGLDPPVKSGASCSSAALSAASVPRRTW
jgi:hypothetical protein